MITAPLVALRFDNGSGTTAANPGTLGGNASVIGNWASFAPLSVLLGPVRTKTRALAGGEKDCENSHRFSSNA